MRCLQHTHPRASQHELHCYCCFSKGATHSQLVPYLAVLVSLDNPVRITQKRFAVNCMEFTRELKQLMYVCLVSFCVATCWQRFNVCSLVSYVRSVCYSTCIYNTKFCCLHSASLWIFEENAVNCVLYATKRQFQNKSQLGRICKLQVSRKNRIYFFYSHPMSHLTKFHNLNNYRNYKIELKKSIFAGGEKKIFL